MREGAPSLRADKAASGRNWPDVRIHNQAPMAETRHIAARDAFGLDRPLRVRTGRMRKIHRGSVAPRAGIVGLSVRSAGGVCGADRSSSSARASSAIRPLYCARRGESMRSRIGAAIPKRAFPVVNAPVALADRASPENGSVFFECGFNLSLASDATRLAKAIQS